MHEGYAVTIEPLACDFGASERTWALMGQTNVQDDGHAENRLVVDMTDFESEDRALVRGFYEGATGNIFEIKAVELSRETLTSARVAELMSQHDPLPAIHVTGALSGASGQINVLQSEEKYLRACRWDRIRHKMPRFPNAIVRALPQCG